VLTSLLSGEIQLVRSFTSQLINFVFLQNHSKLDSLLIFSFWGSGEYSANDAWEFNELEAAITKNYF